MEVLRHDGLKPAAATKTRPSLLRRIGKVLGYGVLVLALAAGAAHLAFLFSGSDKWELLSEENGVAVYAKKVPGSDLKSFRAVFHVKGSLSSIVTFMQDDNSKVVDGFSVGKMVQYVNPQNKVTYFKSAFPKPVTDRDFVVRHTFVQDPVTKAVRYDLKAVPDMAPPEACCVRVPRMNNAWIVTPLKNGDNEIEWLIDMDVGGMVPYFLINEAHPDFMRSFSPELQAIVQRPKYVNAKLDWITEPAP